MEALVLSVIAGVGGMGLGGLLTAIIGRRSPSMGCYLLSFAGGVMTSVVCFGLVPEAVELADSVPVSILGLIIGVVIVMILNLIVDKITVVGKENLKIHHTPEELHHGTNINSKRLIRSGILMISVIALHNIPEGMAIGAGGMHDVGFGMMLAVMIALHNIPEGMAVAAPLIAGGVNKAKVALFVALSGSTTLIGAAVGVLIGGISEEAVALALSAAGGAMLYVVFGEIIPQSIIMTKNRIATLTTLSGIIAGMIISFLPV
jgi:ZIP family zinc transporter